MSLLMFAVTLFPTLLNACRIALSKARGPLHVADVPREKVKKKLSERENETPPHSINGPEKILLSVRSISYSLKCILLPCV